MEDQIKKRKPTLSIIFSLFLLGALLFFSLQKQKVEPPKIPVKIEVKTELKPPVSVEETLSKLEVKEPLSEELPTLEEKTPHIEEEKDSPEEEKEPELAAKKADSFIALVDRQKNKNTDNSLFSVSLKITDSFDLEPLPQTIILLYDKEYAGIAEKIKADNLIKIERKSALIKELTAFKPDRPTTVILLLKDDKGIKSMPNWTAPSNLCIYTASVGSFSSLIALDIFAAANHGKLIHAQSPDSLPRKLNKLIQSQKELLLTHIKVSIKESDVKMLTQEAAIPNIYRNQEMILIFETGYQEDAITLYIEGHNKEKRNFTQEIILPIKESTSTAFQRNLMVQRARLLYPDAKKAAKEVESIHNYTPF